MVDVYTLDKFADGIESLLKKTVSDLGAARGSLMVVDHKSNLLRIKVAVSMDPNVALDVKIIKKARLRVGEGIAGLVAETRKPLLINDIEELRQKHPKLKIFTEPSFYKSSIVVPVLDDTGAAIAVLNINDKLDGDKFTEIEMHFAEILAEYCAVVLKLERQNRGILLVNEIIREISLTNKLSEITKLVVEKGAGILQCRVASLMLVEKDPADGCFYLVVKESTDPTIVGERRMLGESVSGYVWKTGEPVLIKCIEEGMDDRRFKILNKPGSFIVVPLNLKYQTPYSLNVALKGSQTIGVLNFTQRFDDQPFTTEQLETLINYSNLVAIAIEKARYFGESRLAYLSTVKALSAALESKDPYTKGHSDSVESICSKVASKMAMADKEREDLEVAALLHDIGKIGIPESILNKKGKLTKDEYTKIKTHIEEADNILVHTFYLDDSRRIIRCHHEHFDGSGYPARISEDEIPLGARILAAVDAFHAMTSNRPYRKALALDVVRAELIRCKGKQFDPDVIDVLLEVIEQMADEEKSEQEAHTGAHKKIG